MNTVWSKYIQGIDTLYCSRSLRFHNVFAQQYETLFRLDKTRRLKILEIGCGPGALALALQRWYPNAEITAIDRDSEFIRFAAQQEGRVNFLEADATALPFKNDFFDVCISNTVAEHIEPSKFYGEQRRVLKSGGVCLVLSSRKGICAEADCLAMSEYEQTFWEKARQFDDAFEKYEVCRYPMTESQLPAAMENYGFRDVSTAYVTVDLTPDDPKYSPDLAYEMINANRLSALEQIRSVPAALPGRFTEEEINRMLRLTEAKFNVRLGQYARGEKQWDTEVSVIMVLRGIK